MRVLPRRAVAVAALLSLAAISACTVRPLYSNAPVQAGGTETMGAELAAIAVKPITTREAQQVRNHLLFLLHQGGPEPAAPAYLLDINVAARYDTAALVQVTTEDQEPTAATVTMISNYRLTRSSDGTLVSNGRRQVMSSFDIPKQQFAALRARRDAEDRAARELAELLRLSLAQDLASRR